MTKHPEQSELWKPIPGLVGYEASSLGRIRSFWTRVTGGGRGDVVLGDNPTILKLQTQSSGHKKVYAGVGSQRRNHCVHRLVLSAFSPMPVPGLWALHENGNPGDNRPENLRWGTPSDNQCDAVRHGTHDPHHGTKQRNAKLSEEVVREIRATRGKITQKEWAERIGCSRAAIYKVQTGKGWAFVC